MDNNTKHLHMLSIRGSLQIEIHTGSRNFTSWYWSEETPNTKLKRHMPPYVYCSIIYNSQDIEEICVYQQMNE